MDIITRYISKDYLVTFLMTVTVFTFVMCVGAVVKAIDLMARGISGVMILKIFLYNMPYIMSFTVPMSALTTVLLLFSRLSLDGEITAMKACGLTMWQIVAGPILISILLSFGCIYLNSIVAPKGHYARRVVLREMGVEQPVNLLEEGRFVRDFPGMMIYIGKKDGAEVDDVVVYEVDGSVIKRSVRAESGRLTTMEEERKLLVDLYNVRIDQPDPDYPLDPSRTKHVSATNYPVVLDFEQMWGKQKAHKKTSDMTVPELIHAIRNVRESYPDLPKKDQLRAKTKLVIEANKRLSLALSCFAFTLIGIPLGIRSRRKESSFGIGISLLLVFLYYLFIIIADSLVGRPEMHPELVVWIPIAFAEILGFSLLFRAN